MDKDTSEIAKLTERISKDPKSKLFVPLAEEYKKAGDFEMSIHVLTEGLKNNPGYISARSLLGKLLFEKGDLASAQKEFEAVVKSIPDNLMAQRKLGDIYVLLGKPADALPHFKTALSLNPKDQETASLVSDIEAGKDVKPRIPAPKPQAQEETPKTQAQAPGAPSKAGATPQPAPAARKPAGPVSPAAVPQEVEEAEEVLVVEPLEEAAVNLEQALAAENLGFLSEPVPAALPPSPEEEAGGIGEAPIAAAEQPAAGEGETTEGIEFPGIEAGATELPAFEEAGKAADDFSTDTLAELYISQGFYEKAVDIYERMLADNPDSQGLKNKLASVRAMAAQAAPVAEPKAAEMETAFAVPEGAEAGPFEVPSAELTSEIPEFTPPAEAEPLQPETAGGELFAKEAIQQPPAEEAGFEPKEYIPPDAVPLPGPEAQAGAITAGEQAAKEVSAAKKAAAAGRKETIERLENWLHNIMKEK